MNYNALNGYLDALQQKMNDNISSGNNPNAHVQYELYSGHADAIEFTMRHLRYGTKLTATEAHDYSRTLCHLFAPSMIEKHLPQHRRTAVYQATSQLAHAMERLAAGKRSRKLFGIF